MSKRKEIKALRAEVEGLAGAIGGIITVGAMQQQSIDLLVKFAEAQQEVNKIAAGIE